MKRFLAGMTLIHALGLGPVQASEPDIQGVIANQVEAMRADDFASAFTYASPNIKGIFGTPERFGQMVRQGYPMVYRPKDIRFLDLRTVAGLLYQRVLVTDAEGRIHMLDYQMIETPDGWQINGVQLLKAGDVGA